MKFWQNNLCEKTKFQFFKLFCVMTAESERSRIITALHRYERARANGSGLRSHHCVRTHGYMTRELLVEIGTTFSLPNLNTGPRANLCKNTNFSFRSTRPFERLERSSESPANLRIGPLSYTNCISLLLSICAGNASRQSRYF